MENENLYRVYYASIYVKDIFAHSRWEAVELVYSRLTERYPNLIRGKFKAKKV